MAAAAWRAISASGRRGRPSVSITPVARPRSQSGTTSTPRRCASPARSSARPAESSSGPIASGTSIRSGRRSGPATRSRCEPSMSTTYSASGTSAMRCASATSWSGSREGATTSKTWIPSSSTGLVSSEPTGGQRLVGGLRGRGRPVPPDRLEQGRRGRGSAGRAWTGTRRRPPRCPRSQAWATARAGGGSPRGSCSASAPCSRAGRSCRAVDAIAGRIARRGADRGHP